MIVFSPLPAQIVPLLLACRKSENLKAIPPEAFFFYILTPDS
jgi:hypothetical protein